MIAFQDFIIHNMITTNITKVMEALTVKIKEDLIKKLKAKGHVESGHLEKSIEIKFHSVSNKYTLDLSSLLYLECLDEGKFLKDFIKEEEKIIEENVSKAIIKDILDTFKI